MPRKTSAPIAPIAPVAPVNIAPAGDKRTFDAIASMIRSNTQCTTTLATVDGIVAGTVDTPGVPGFFDSIPADYATGIAKLHFASTNAVEGGNMAQVIGNQIAVMAGYVKGAPEVRVRSAQKTVLSQKFREGRKLAGK